MNGRENSEWHRAMGTAILDAELSPASVMPPLAPAVAAGAFDPDLDL